MSDFLSPLLFILTDESGNKLHDLFLLPPRQARDIFKDLLHFSRWSSFLA
ncbi:MAG: hypothetical protein AABN95_14685 [Acidobacteriota bacterium]